MTPKEYKQMMDYLTRSGVKDKVKFASDVARPDPKPEVKEIEAINAFMKRNPRADGGRIGFKVPGLVKGTTSKIKTDEFQYPVKFLNRKTGNIETVYRKEPKPQGAKRVSKLIDTYKTALDDFQNQVDDAIQSKDVSKLPKNFAQYLRDKKLNDSTYQSLLKRNQLPNIETNTSKIRLNFANSLIKDANESLKFINAETLFKNAGFTQKEYKSLFATKQLSKLDKAIDKVGKAFNSLFNTQTNPKAVDLFNPVEKIAELTGLNNQKISNRLGKLDIKNKSPELHRAFRLFSNPNFKKNIKTNFPDLTLSKFLSTPESFFADVAQVKSAAKRKDRLEVAAKKAGESVADINKAQDEVVSLLNKFYKDNPQELLGNTKLRNLLDLTLKDGEIVKKNKYVSDDDFLKLIKEKPGLFTIDHIDEVQSEKLSTEFPIFRQLATYNTNSGLIKSIKSYVSKNQNSTDPVVQNKIKKQIEFLEDLKLRVDTPTGRIGSKEVLKAIDRDAGVLPNFLAQLKALNIKIPGKAKAALLGIGGGLGVTTFVSAGPIEETGTTGFTTGEKLAGAGTAAGAYKFRKPIIKGAKAVGRGALKLLTPLAVPLEAGFVLGDLKSGSTVPEAIADAALMGGIFRERDKRKFIEDKYGTETLNRYVAAKTPGITDVMDMPTALPALSQELQAIDAEADDYLQTLRGQRAEEFKIKSALPKPQIDAFQAAGGGIAKLAGDRSGAMLESMNPDKDGLQGLMKRVRNL